jgi:glycosyltransferase involved in cell wall biosynthesis
MSVQESQVIEGGLVCSARAVKKVLFVTKTNEYGGAEIHLLQLIRSVRESGLQLSILCVHENVFTGRFDGDRPVEIITCKQTPESLFDWVRLFRSLQPDVAVFVYSWLRCFPSIAQVGAWLAGIPKLYAIQHALPSPAPPKVKGRSVGDLLRRFVGKRARHFLAAAMTPNLWNRTICVSNAVREALIRDYRFPAGRTVTVHNGVSLSEFVPSSKDAGVAVRQRFGLAPDEFVLACSARLTEHKGVDVLLAGLARAFGQGVSCKCFILGDGPQREELLEQARKMRLLDRVFFVGFQEDVRPYLQASSAFVLTSHTEGGGGPLSVLEAMACGLPCIVTGVGGSVEAITDQLEGLVVPPASPQAVADAICYLVTNPDKCAEMARSARATACHSFNIDDRMAEIRRVILN